MEQSKLQVQYNLSNQPWLQSTAEYIEPIAVEFYMQTIHNLEVADLNSNSCVQRLDCV